MPPKGPGIGREQAMAAAEGSLEPFSVLAAKAQKYIEAYHRGFFPPYQRRQEEKKQRALERNESCTRRWSKRGSKLSSAQVTDILHRVFILEHPYSAIAQAYGIT